MLTVRDAMTREPATVRQDATVAEAVQLLQRSGCGDLMVLSADGRWNGVLSEGDVLRALLPRYSDLPSGALLAAEDTLPGRASDLAAAPLAPLVIRDAISVAPGDTLLRAMAVMASMQIRRLPVVEETRLVGTLGRSDVLAALFGAGRRRP